MNESKLLNIEQFKFKQILSKNPTEKRVVVLGTVQKQDGQAIMILNAKTPDQQVYRFNQINKVFQNDIYSRFDVRMEGQYEIQAIYPINQKHKSKYRQKILQTVKQSAQDYQSGKEQLLKKELAHIDWVDNIILGKAESQRILLRKQRFIILPDFKFSNLSETQNLHLLVIFTQKQLHSIRDLRGKHLQLLRQVQKSISEVLHQKFNISQSACRMFCHYPPTFYQLHIHVTNLRSLSTNALVQRSHLLQNIIFNLEVDQNYYTKAALIKTIEK